VTNTVKLECPTGTGDLDLKTFEEVEKVMNVPTTDYVRLTMTNGDREKVPCATVVSVVPTDESPT